MSCPQLSEKSEITVATTQRATVPERMATRKRLLKFISPEGSDRRASANGARDHCDHEQDQEDDEKDLRDRRCGSGDPGKSQGGRDQCDNKKGKGPAKHDILLFLGQCDFWMTSGAVWPVPALTGTEGGRGFAQTLGLDAMGLIRLAALALVALILALFVVRPLLRPAATVVQLPPRAPNDGGPASLTGPALTGEITDRDPEIARLRSLGADGRAAGSDSSAEEAQDADPVARMRALIAGRQDETLEILRGWIDDRPTGTDNQTSEGR